MTDPRKALRRVKLRRFALAAAVLLGGAVLIVVLLAINPTCPGEDSAPETPGAL